MFAFLFWRSALAASTACTPSDGVPLGLGNPSDNAREIEALRAEVARLKDENARRGSARHWPPKSIPP